MSGGRHDGQELAGEVTATVEPPPGFRYVAARLEIPGAGTRLMEELAQDGWRISLDAASSTDGAQTYIRRYRALLGGWSTHNRLSEAAEYFGRKLCEHDCFGDVDLEEWVSNYRVPGRTGNATARLRVHRARRLVTQVPSFSSRYLELVSHVPFPFWLFIVVPTLAAILTAFSVKPTSPTQGDAVTPLEIFWTGFQSIPWVVQVGFPLLALSGFIVTTLWLRWIPLRHGVGFTVTSTALSLVVYFGFSQLPKSPGPWLMLCTGVLVVFTITWLASGAMSTSDLTARRALSLTSVGWLSGGVSLLGLYKGLEYAVDYYFSKGLGLDRFLSNLPPHQILQIAAPAVIITLALLALQLPCLRFVAQLTSKAVGLLMIALGVTVTLYSGLEAVKSQAFHAGQQVLKAGSTDADPGLAAVCMTTKTTTATGKIVPSELVVTRLKDGYGVLRRGPQATMRFEPSMPIGEPTNCH